MSTKESSLDKGGRSSLQPRNDTQHLKLILGRKPVARLNLNGPAATGNHLIQTLLALAEKLVL